MSSDYGVLDKYEVLPAAFHFKVVFESNLVSDNSFQEVSGISTEIETESLVEGGSPYVRKLPTKIKYPNLVLKRGIAAKDSELVKWCRSVMENFFAKPIVPRQVNVYLINEAQTPIRGWGFANAYPVKWDVEPFNSMKNEIAIEKIELCYQYSLRLP